jgi:hypothetical protein
MTGTTGRFRSLLMPPRRVRHLLPLLPLPAVARD